MKRAFFAGAILLAACGGEVEPDPVVPPPCAAGEERDYAGNCSWIVPAQTCDPHTSARLGEKRCQPIGAGPCAAPFEADGDWSCKAIEASAPCPEGSAPFLGERECRPAGWTTCPNGFEKDNFGCRPVITQDECLGATRHKLGSTSCEPLATCAAPQNADLFVDENFEAGELDATHFATVIAAVNAARDGAVIAIAPGSYNGRVQIRRTVTLIGTCPEEVSITGGVAIAEPGATATLRNLTLAENAFGFGAARGARGSLENVLIQRTHGAGIVVRDGGSQVTAANVLIRDVDSLPAGNFGRGVTAEAGGRAILRDVTILRSREAAVIATATSTLDLDGVLAIGTRASAQGRGGFGLAVVAGGRFSAARVAIDGCREHGVLVTGASSRGSLQGLHVVRCGGAPVSAAVRVEDGGALDLRGATLIENVTTGLLADDPSTTATVADTWITRSTPSGAGDPIAGVLMLEQAKVHLDNVAITEVDIAAAAYFQGDLTITRSYSAGRERSIGALASGARISIAGSTFDRHPAGAAIAEDGAELFVQDSAIHGTTIDGRIASSGILAIEGSSLILDRSVISGVEGMGVTITSSATEAIIRGTLIRDIRATENIVGQGIASNSAQLEMEDVHLANIDGIALIALGEATITRVTASDTKSTRPTNGAAIAVGGKMILRDIAVAKNQLAGVVLGSGEIEIDGLLVTGTTPTESGTFGHGLFGEGARVRATNLDLSSNAAVGIGFDGGAGTVSRSIIAKNAVGAHAQNGVTLVQREGGELKDGEVAFTPDVLFLENGTRVGVGNIPVPSPFEDLP